MVADPQAGSDGVTSMNMFLGRRAMAELARRRDDQGAFAAAFADQDVATNLEGFVVGQLGVAEGNALLMRLGAAADAAADAAEDAPDGSDDDDDDQDDDDDNDDDDEEEMR